MAVPEPVAGAVHPTVSTYVVPVAPVPVAGDKRVLCSTTAIGRPDEAPVVYWSPAGKPVDCSNPILVADDVPAPVDFTAVTWKPNLGSDTVLVFVPVILMVYD